VRRPDNEFWLAHNRHVEYMASLAVGFSVEVYCVGPELTGARRGDRWQVLPGIESDDKAGDFMAWHMENSEQWFTTPIEAAAQFVRAYKKWLNLSGSHNAIQSS
jgi:hypothetical protein